MTEEERVRALRAEALLGDETFNEALNAIEARLTEQWKTTAQSAISLREEHWSQLRALQSIRSQLQSWVSDLAFVVRQNERRKT